MHKIPRLNWVLGFLAALLAGFAIASLLRPGPVGAQYPTPLGVDVLSPIKPAGAVQTSKGEYVTVAASATQSLINYSGGDGYLSEIFVAVGNSDSNGRMRSRLKIYYNGEGSPTIDDTLERLTYSVDMDALGGERAFNNPYTTANYNGSSNTSFTLRMPIPYTGGIKVDLTNGSSTTASTIWYVIVNHTGVADNWPNTRRLREASYASGNGGCTINSTVTLVDASAVGVPGRFLGLWWMQDTAINGVSVKSAPMEGNFSIYLDGSGSASYVSSGTEDYFQLGNYGAGIIQFPNAVNSSTNGSNFLNYWTGTTYRYDGGGTYVVYGFWRWHYEDPITFSTGLKITWQCGDTTEVSFTGNPVVWATVWYYTQN